MAKSGGSVKVVGGIKADAHMKKAAKGGFKKAKAGLKKDKVK